MKRYSLLVLIIIGISRFIAPLFLALNPIGIYLICAFLDIVDGQVAYQAGFSFRRYSLYDKLLDYWLYIGIILFCYQLSIFPVIFILFIIRSVSQFLVEFTRKDIYFLYFPSILERFFVFYLLSLIYQPLAYLFIGNNQIIPLTISIFITLPHEYLFHVNGPGYGHGSWSSSIKSKGQLIKKNVE